MLVSKLFAVLLIIISVGGVIRGDNWCQVEQKYCHGLAHIVCKNGQFPYGKCSNVHQIPEADIRDIIVERHNYHRSQLAGGRVPRFPAASKMTEMKWDGTLSFVAKEHIKHCNFQHDECRATEKFPFSGQNLAYSASTVQNSNVRKVLTDMIDSWFDEHKIANPSVVNKFQYSDMNAGHFTVMSRENNLRVGCGYITYDEDKNGRKWFSHMLTCNYAETNMVGTGMYTKGPACSKCQEAGRGCNRNLCKT